LLKALVPLLPVVLLVATGPPPLGLFDLGEKRWLVGPDEPERLAGSRRIAAAMLIGVVAASIAGRTAARVPPPAFAGAGYAFVNIVSIIVCATAFGRGVEVIGLAGLLGDALKLVPGLVVPSATLLPSAFAFVCGSGMAATQSLFAFFVEPAKAAGLDPL